MTKFDVVVFPPEGEHYVYSSYDQRWRAKDSKRFLEASLLGVKVKIIESEVIRNGRTQEYGRGRRD